MTRNKDFKRLVRERMAKTAESYTAARAALLAEREVPAPVAGVWRSAGVGADAVRFRLGRNGVDVDRADRQHPAVRKWLRDNALDTDGELAFAVEEASMLETDEEAALVAAARMPSVPLRPGAISFVETVEVEAIRDGKRWLLTWPVLLTEFEASAAAGGTDLSWRLRTELGSQCDAVKIHFIEGTVALITATVTTDSAFASGLRFEATREDRVLATNGAYPGFIGSGPTRGAALKDLRDAIALYENDWRNQVDDDTAAYIENQDDD